MGPIDGPPQTKLVPCCLGQRQRTDTAASFPPLLRVGR